MRAGCGAAIAPLLLSWPLASQAVSLTLAWDAPNDTNAVGYKLHFSRGTGPVDIVDAGNNLRVTVDTFQPATTYRCSVTSYNPYQYESKPSGPIFWTTATVVSSLDGDSHVRLTWPPAEKATGYIVKRSRLPDGPYTAVQTNLTTTWVDEQVLNEERYSTEWRS